MRHLKLLFIALILSNLASAQKPIENYSYKFKIKGTIGDTLYMANYLGSKLYYFDTAYVDNKGIANFTGNSINPGIYAVVIPGPKYFELVVNEQFIEIETDPINFVKHMNVIKSEENKAFFKFINYVNDKKNESNPIAKKYGDSLTPEDEKNELKLKLQALDKEVKDYQKSFDDKYYPKLFCAALLSLNYNLTIPDSIPKKDHYYYYKQHYFDRLDFNDDRFVRSPAFTSKIETYFTQFLPQDPDTILQSAFEIIDNIKDEKSDTWKYVVHYVTNKFEQSKQMGMDKVLVKMAEKYYCNPGETKAYWMPENKLAELCEKVTVGNTLLIGVKSPNLILQDTSEQKWVNIHNDIKSKWTFIVFWDPECGHCKKEVPLINDYFQKVKDSIDVSIVGVCGLLDNKGWTKFIKEKELDDWIHISDNNEIHNNPYNYLDKTTIKSLNFRQTYDVYSYPQIYILDENKIIRAKKIGAESLEKIMDQLISPQNK